MGISVVIHTCNSEELLENCLQSVKDFDEIVICDMYSDDRTLEIAKKYNCKIVMHEKTGYVEPARNFAISQASNEYVLLVDSDEVVPEELKNYLYNFVETNKKYSAIRIPRLNYYWGVKIEIQYPDYVTRFMKKTDVNWPPQIHAQPEISGEIYTINKKHKELAFRHYTVSSVSQLFITMNKYTEYEVEKMIAKHKKMPNMIFVFLKSMFLVFEKFFIKNGYKAGIDGFILCVYFGVYKFLSNVKYREYLIKNGVK